MIKTTDPVDPALLDVVLPDSGYPAHLQAMDTRDVLMSVCGAATRAFPKEYWIEPKEWVERAKYLDEKRLWAMNYVDRFTNQNPTHECTCHSLSRNFECAWNRQRGIIYPDGPKKNFRYPESSRGSVWVSPLSVYAEANPGQWGGANVQQVLEIACRRGMLPEKIQPFDYKFKHDLVGTTGQGNSNQSHGDWVRLSSFPAGWQETASLLMPDEVCFPESYEQAVCLLLNSIAVSVGRNGHAIPWCQWIASNGSAAYPDSYDLIRYDSANTLKSAWRGSFAILSVKTPGNWLDPAGTLAV